MTIDWFTVIAQIINFLVLVWLLKRFLYKPILNAIDTRDQKIKSQIEEANAKVEEATSEQEEFQRKNTEFDQQRKSMLAKATDEAKATRQQMLESARKEAEELRAKLEKSLQEERLHLDNEIVRRTQKEVFAIARKVLADLASESLEEQMTRVFVERLKQLEEKTKMPLVHALSTSGEPVVRSAFELSPDQRSEIEQAVKGLSTAEFKTQFEVDGDKISGIELSCGGYKIAWSISEYLSTLEKRVSEIFGQPPDEATETNAGAVSKAQE